MLSAYFVGQVGARNMASRFENMAKAGEEEAAKRREEEKSKREAREKAEREKQEKAEQERLARLAEQEAQRAPVGCVSVVVGWLVYFVTNIWDAARLSVYTVT